MATLLLIDGNAIMHRAFHAIPSFKTRGGVPTNVVYGFLSMLVKSVSDFKPTYLIICFDTPKPTFRNKLLKEYQAHRPHLHDEFRVQIPLVKEMLDKAGFCYYEKDGYEADDIIGTITRKKSESMKVLILTGDKDILQMVRKNVVVISPQGGLSSSVIYDTEAVIKKLGIPPEKIPDFKGLAGDPSDNYKGAKGIGPKTAAKLVQEYGTVENLLLHASEIPLEKVKAIITKQEKNILLSKELAKIKTDVDIEIDIEKTRFDGFDKPALRSFLLTLEMYSMLNKLFPNNKKPIRQKKELGTQTELFS